MFTFGSLCFKATILGKAQKSVLTWVQLRCLSSEHLKILCPETVSLLKQYHYLKPQKEGKTPDLDILSLEVTNNIKSEWWRTFVKSKKHVHGVEFKTSQDSAHKLEVLLAEHVFPKMMEKAKTEDKLPFSVAVNIVSDRGQNDGLHYYVPIAKEELALNYESLVFEQLKFLRNYLNKPANLISMRNASESDKVVHNDVTVFKYNGSKLEVINSRVLNCSEVSKVNGWDEVTKEHGNNMAIVEFKFDVCAILCSFFADAYHQIKFTNYETLLFRLHPYLTPIKVAVAIKGDKTDKLKEVVSHLCSEVRQMNATCWDASQMRLSFAELDRAGVMYCVVVDDETFDKGLVHLRDRNTGVEMPIHFTKVVEKLFFYLKPR